MKYVPFTRKSAGARAGSLAIALALAAALSACSRMVDVADAGSPATVGPAPAAMQAGGGSTDEGGSLAGAPGAQAGAGGAAPEMTAPAATPIADAGEAAGATVMDGIDQIGGSAGAHVDQIQILAVFLSSIEVPAVGSDGVSVAQYYGANQAATLYSDWSGVLAFWHLTMRTYYIDTAASLDRHLGLVYGMGTYGIHSADDPNEMSGTPASYKEYLAANPDGFAWVDYPATTRAPGAPPVSGEPGALGAIVFQTWSGERSELTDTARYRARLDLSATDVAYVEYADTAEGTPGQIVVQAIDGGEPRVVAPSPNHQDRPAIDGDWVVWEEYLTSKDTVIRGYNLVTSELRDLSAATGFRTNPDILGTRVVWEDQRGNDGDIYFTDLADEEGERVAVSGAGHSAATRLSADGPVWIETADGVMALMRARWTD